jgi:hypothetical protein
MGIKKIARPMNKAKNDFVKWLKDNNATNIEEYKSDDGGGFIYYRSIDAFIGERLYMVRFMVWNTKITIDYSDDHNRYNDMSIEDFRKLID